ncbi:MAG: NADP-dependent phosphogluconate dehydrogenase, partial [Acidobacteriota bacterium]
MTASGSCSGTASFGMVGLGVMGNNLALNIEQHGIPIAVFDIRSQRVGAFVAEHGRRQLSGATTLPELVRLIGRPRRIMLMVPAGAPVDRVLEQLVPLLEPGDLVIDGGNSYFKDTMRREAELAAQRVFFLGVGVSGGEEGARRGPSLMPGGAKQAYTLVAPVFESIAARSDAGPCVAWLGTNGAGHFVKMVHNGIEYAIMEAYGEGFEMLKASPYG